MHQIDPIKRERATAVLVHFCHTKSRFQEKKIFWALPWENLRLLMWPKNPISSYFGQNSEMQNCQDYTDPTVPAAEESKLHKAEIGGNEDNLWIWGYQRQD